MLSLTDAPGGVNSGDINYYQPNPYPFPTFNVGVHGASMPDAASNTELNTIRYLSGTRWITEVASHVNIYYDYNVIHGMISAVEDRMRAQLDF